MRLVLGRTPSGARCLLAASLWPAIGCAAQHDPGVDAPILLDATPPLGPDGGVAAGLDAGALDAGTIVGEAGPSVIVVPPPRDAGDHAIDPRYPFQIRDAGPKSCWQVEEIVFAELPPEGVPAELHQICTQPATELVQSGWSARVTLEPDPGGASRARGSIEIAPELSGRVLGVPEVKLSSADFTGLSASTPSRNAAGMFELQISWQGLSSAGLDSFRQLTALVRFDVSCAPAPEAGANADASAGERRSVETRNELYLCNERPGTRWISSGESCRTCAIIAEMAPSPIVPMPRASELPLELVLRLNLRTIAVVGRDLLVYAEHDGGAADAAYEWHPSAGEVHALTRDVVLWRLPPDCHEPQLLQAVVEARGAVAVASVRYRGGVA